MPKLLGVSRDEIYSPNMTANDREIFMAVAKRLEERGCEVDVMEERVMTRAFLQKSYDLVFTMARHANVLSLLSEFSQLHPGRVINSPEGIKSCDKAVITDVMKHLCIPMPNSYVLDLTSKPSLPAQLSFPLWVKRGDQCAQCKEDVNFVEDHTALLEVLLDFKFRGVTHAVLSAHQEGDIVKFYSVAGTTFFDWDYADPAHSKYGHEAINGVPNKYPFNPNKLKEEADRLADALGVPVYGGDCVVDADGHFYIIDFNDWPSFSRCRYRASIAIAERIMNVLKDQDNG